MKRIPTMISYSPQTSSYEAQWGDDFSPSAIVVTDILHNLELQGIEYVNRHCSEKTLQSSVSFDMKGRTAGTGKSATDVATDFLREACERILRYLDRAFPKFAMRNRVTDFVVTVPSDWPCSTLDILFEVLDSAFHLRETFPGLSSILALSESEAAAWYAVKWLKEQSVDFLKVWHYHPPKTTPQNKI
jgi:hypothetical protein